MLLLFELQKKNPKFVRTKNDRIMVLSKCAVCDSKNMKNLLKASRVLSSLGMKTPLSKIPLVGPLLFHEYSTS